MCGLGARSVWAQVDPMVEMAAEALKVTVDQTGDKWLERVKARPDDPDEQAFADWLLARPDIASAVVDGQAIEATTLDGITIRYCDYQPGVKGAGASEMTSALQPMLQAVTGKQRGLGDITPGGEALIIDITGEIFSDTDCALENMLAYAKFNVVEMKGGVSAFKEMENAAITIMNTHGGMDAKKKHYWVVAEQHESTNVSHLEEYYRYMRQGQVYLARVVQRNKKTHQPEKIITYTELNDSWFANHISSLPNNAAVFILACESMDVEASMSMWPTLRAKGAAFYFGFTGLVTGDWALDWVSRYLDLLTGAHLYKPWDTDPPRRPLGYEDAFHYIKKHHAYVKDPAYGAEAHANLDQETMLLSLAPHIEMATVLLAENKPNMYDVHLIGAFGPPRDAKVYCDGKQVDFSSADNPAGGILDVLVPLGTTGSLIVKDKWGRESNPITISRFIGQVKFNYSDPEKEGTVTLTYDALTTATRLYHPQDRDQQFAGLAKVSPIAVSTASIVRSALGGLPAGIPGALNWYPLVGGGADWSLEWDFHSVKKMGPTTITAQGAGQANGHGSPTDEDAPHGFLVVKLKPLCDSASAFTAQAEVTAFAEVGPITVKYDFPNGERTEQVMIPCGGMPTTVDYDLDHGKLPECGVATPGFANWKMQSVTLTPNPYDMKKSAWLPEELDDATRLGTLASSLFAPPSRG